MPIELAVVAAKVTEVGAKAAEVGVKAAEKGKKAIDIGKRVDVTKEVASGAEKGVDISKRVIPKELASASEVSSGEIKSALKEYVSDLKAKSPCAETIPKNCIDPGKIEVQSPEKVKEMRKEFNQKSVKDKLRAEWEKLNNQEWPTYKEDVLNSRGEVVRKAGDKFDAHHIKPLKLGGLNEASNITPLDMTKHADIHSNTGSCKKLVDVVSGGKA